MPPIDDHFLDVNKHGVLRIPLGLWLALVFLARDWAIGLSVLASSSMSQDTIKLISANFDWRTTVIEIPAALALWLCLQRRPEAGEFVRAAWPYARLLASMTAVLHIIYVIWSLWNSSYWLPWPELYLMSCALIDFSIIVAMYSSDHLKQVFAEFPAKA